MAELKTEPGWKPAPSRKPWWAVALVSGVGAGAAIAAALGLNAMPVARGEPALRTSAVVQAPSQSEQEWRSEVTRSLQDLRERMARIEGRLERR